MAHIQYEEKQKVESVNVFPLFKQKETDMHFVRLMNTLDDFITKRETSLMRGGESPEAEISIAINMAVWAVACVCSHADKAASLVAEESQGAAENPAIRVIS